VAHVPDSTLRHLRQLSPDIQRAAYYLIWAARQAGYPLQITSSVRTRQRQASLFASGASNTLKSKHLIGQAFDVDIHGVDRDDVPSWFWWELGPFAERLGFRWGGRWKSPKDFGHFENPRAVV